MPFYVRKNLVSFAIGIQEMQSMRGLHLGRRVGSLQTWFGGDWAGWRLLVFGQGPRA